MGPEQSPVSKAMTQAFAPPLLAVPGFAHVETWIFDLDNTLYPSHARLWPQVDERITLYIAEMFGIDGMSARALQKYYYTATARR